VGYSKAFPPERNLCPHEFLIAQVIEDSCPGEDWDSEPPLLLKGAADVSLMVAVMEANPS
jgi:hypothetical protein